jgi:hypothetical protein
MNPHSYVQLIFKKCFQNIQWRNKFISKCCWKEQDIGMKKTETISVSFNLYKYQLKWIKNLIIRPETVMQVPEKLGSTLEHISISNNFPNRTLMVTRRERISKKTMKLKSSTQMVTQLKMQLWTGRKIFTSIHLSRD